MAVNLSHYVDNVRESLKPPVSNKILFDGSQIKVMIVGGPNQRKDFHVEKGEELFYMLVGDMDLDIMEDGVVKRIPIDEGNFFLLPACVPHSPQRYANTIGIVFERERFANEMDCLRWYVPKDSETKMSDEAESDVLYEEMFHCTDLGTQIKAVIERFNASVSAGTIVPNAASDAAIANYFTRPDNIPSSDFSHFTLKDKCQELSSGIMQTGAMPTAETLMNSEFRVDLISNSLPVSLNCEMGGDVFLWQQTGESEIYESEQESEAINDISARKATVHLKAGEVIHLKRPMLANSSPILVAQLDLGGVVVCVTNSSIPQPLLDI